MTTTRNLLLLAIFLENDEFLKNYLLKRIEECIQVPVNAKTPRRVNAQGIFDLSKLEPKEREKNISRLKELEMLDIFLAKNHLFLEDREKLESHSNLSRGIISLYSDNPLYERIKMFFTEEKAVLRKFASRAEEKRKSYLGIHAGGKSNEKDILVALKLSPLGSDIMVEILYDLYQNKIGIGVLGEGISETTLESISNERFGLSKNKKFADPVEKAS